MRRRGRDLRAVDRDDPDLDQPARAHSSSTSPNSPVIACSWRTTKPRDRGVIGRLVGADHPERDVLATAPLDPPRRALPDRIRVDEQRDHHRRIMRRPAMTVGAIARIERGQIHLLNSVEHEPRQVLLRQPLPQARRQQQLLLTITRDEVLRHRRIVLNPPDATPVCATPSAKAALFAPARRSAGARRTQQRAGRRSCSRR